MFDRNVVPIGKARPDRLGALGVVFLHLLQRVIRQHDTPAKGVIGAVALKNNNLVLRVTQLHRDGKIEARRAAP